MRSLFKLKKRIRSLKMLKKFQKKSKKRSPSNHRFPKLMSKLQKTP
jgi:hypothetical protein